MKMKAKKIYRGVKGERIVVDDSTADEIELKRQWSMVEKQNRKLSSLHCMMYDKVAKRDALYAILMIVIGLAILSLLLF